MLGSKRIAFLCKKFMLWRQDQAWLARLVEPSLVSLMIILISVALVLKESRRLSRGCRGCLDPPPPQRYGPLLQYIESSPPLSSCWFSCLIFPSLKLLKQKRSPLRCSKIARKCQATLRIDAGQHFTLLDPSHLFQVLFRTPQKNNKNIWDPS